MNSAEPPIDPSGAPPPIPGPASPAGRHAADQTVVTTGLLPNVSDPNAFRRGSPPARNAQFGQPTPPSGPPPYSPPPPVSGRSAGPWPGGPQQYPPQQHPPQTPAAATPVRAVPAVPDQPVFGPAGRGWALGATVAVPTPAVPAPAVPSPAAPAPAVPSGSWRPNLADPRPAALLGTSPGDAVRRPAKSESCPIRSSEPFGELR